MKEGMLPCMHALQWLTYWTLYGSLILAEHVADQVWRRRELFVGVDASSNVRLKVPTGRDRLTWRG